MSEISKKPKMLAVQFSENELKSMQAYFKASQFYSEEIRKDLDVFLSNHTVWKNHVTMQSDELSKLRWDTSKKLLEDALFNDQWEPYILSLSEYGSLYATMDIDYSDFYESQESFKKLEYQYIHRQFGAQHEKVKQITEGMNKTLDFSIHLVAEAYFKQKDRLVEKNKQDVLELNRRLEKRLEEAQEINKELETFGYSVSHDLRAPLRAIEGFSKILKDKYADEMEGEAKRYVGIISENAMKMSGLLDDILNYSRTGRKRINPSSFNLTQLFNEVKNELMKGYDVDKIDFQLEELGDIKGDREMIKQVAYNLVDNALKFSRSQEKSKINVKCIDQKGERIYQIQDNGVGFNMKYADNLFGLFQSMHDQVEFEGHGVGLAIANRIIHRHSGRIWAEAKENEGATFYFTLGGVSDVSEKSLT